MIYKVGLCGATGRMGLETAALISQSEPLRGDLFELADAVARSGRLQSVEGVSIRQIHEPAREPVHVWIDFSRPEGTLQLLDTITTPVVIATTGFSEGQLEKIMRYAARFPVVLAPNTSPGVHLLTQWLRQLPAGLGENFDIVVDETHHKRKKDSPSGTAKQLVAEIARRGVSVPPVVASRAGGLPGEHRIRLIGEEEELTLLHRAWDRKVFARGALHAARFVVRVSRPGLYGMGDVYGE